MTADDALRLVERRARALALATREEHPDRPVVVRTSVQPRGDGFPAPWTYCVRVYQGDAVILSVDSPADDPLAAVVLAPDVLEAKIRAVCSRLAEALRTGVDGAEMTDADDAPRLVDPAPPRAPRNAEALSETPAPTEPPAPRRARRAKTTTPEATRAPGDDPQLSLEGAPAP